MNVSVHRVLRDAEEHPWVADGNYVKSDDVFAGYVVRWIRITQRGTGEDISFFFPTSADATAFVEAVNQAYQSMVAMESAE